MKVCIQRSWGPYIAYRLVGIPEECSRKERNCVSGCGLRPSKGLSSAWQGLSAFTEILTMCVTIRFQGLHGEFAYELYTGPTHTHCTCIGNLGCKLPLSDPHCGVWVHVWLKSQDPRSLGSIYKNTGLRRLESHLTMSSGYIRLGLLFGKLRGVHSCACTVISVSLIEWTYRSTSL